MKEFLIRDFLFYQEEIFEVMKNLSGIEAIKFDSFRVDVNDKYYIYKLQCDSSFVNRITEQKHSALEYAASPIYAWFSNQPSIMVLIHVYYSSCTLYRIKGFVYNDSEAFKREFSKRDRNNYKMLLKKYKKYTVK